LIAIALPAAVAKPLPFDFGRALCIRTEQMHIDEQGAYSRSQTYSAYTCQDSPQVVVLSGHWAPATTGYAFAPDQVLCAHAPASAIERGDLLQVEWFQFSPSPGQGCYTFTWTFTYQKQ